MVAHLTPLAPPFLPGPIHLAQGFKRRNEKYALFWPQKPEFVRMAARFSATVVPVSN